MSNKGEGEGGMSDDFFEQIMAVVPSSFTAPPNNTGGFVPHDGVSSAAMRLQHQHQLGSSSSSSGVDGYRGIEMGLHPHLGLNSDHHLHHHQDGDGEGPTTTASSSLAAAATNDRDFMHLTSLFPAFGEPQPQSIQLPTPSTAAQLHQTFQSQPAAPRLVHAVTNHPARPRVRARRGQATDPHSIAERLRRERISERMKALQELVPSCNKTDKAAMLDEILDYVKFLRLQVKVLSMSRLGGASAIAQLVSDMPPSSMEGEGAEGGMNQQAWEKWCDDGTEEEVAKLMEVDVGAAMQLLQSKTLCLMPISLATAISRTNQAGDVCTFVKPESNSIS